MQVLAAIFDLDGTIIDNEEAWAKAYTNVFKSLGANLEGEGVMHVFGASTEKNIKDGILKYNIKTEKSVGELVALTFTQVQKLIPEMSLNEGVTEFMEDLKESGIPVSLATSSNWETTDKVLKNFGLSDFFESITTIEEITDAKPDPEIYILASEKLGIDPADCLVFEDSPAGVTAAKEAGMKVIAIDPTGENEELETADLVITGFSDINPKVVDRL